MKPVIIYSNYSRLFFSLRSIHGRAFTSNSGKRTSPRRGGWVLSCGNGISDDITVDNWYSRDCEILSGVLYENEVLDFLVTGDLVPIIEADNRRMLRLEAHRKASLMKTERRKQLKLLTESKLPGFKK